jgi:transposase
MASTSSIHIPFIPRTISGHIVAGVDTHKHIHVAAIADTTGGIQATMTIATDTGGFQQLLA